MKVRKYSLLFLFLLGIIELCNAQFEGRIEYAMSYQTSDVELKMYEDALPKKCTLLIHNEHLRFEQALAGGGKQAFVANANLGTSILLMNFLGQEFQVKMDESELLQLKKTKKLQMIESEKTKMIAGYLCKEAFAIDGADTLHIFYSPDIQTPTILPQFESLKGLPLQYEVVKGSLNILYVCTEVKTESVSLENFEVSDKIKEIPFAEFARSFAISK